MTPLIQLKQSTSVFLIAILLAYVAIPQRAQAAPDPGSVGGVLNTADGFNAMPLMSAGTANSAFGAFALFSAVSANFNTAVGGGALLNNSADGNTAVGAATLFNNTTGIGNTAVGTTALLSNVTGSGNTAVGARALLNNTTPEIPGQSSLNTAVGLDALGGNTTGGSNTAVGGGTNDGLAGNAPLGSNTTGSGNTAVGAAGGGSNGALGKNTAGGDNTAIGVSALNSNTTGSGNTVVGSDAGSNLTTGDNNIDIGNAGVANEANTIRIGADQTRTFIAGISGQHATGGDPVFITSAGKLGTVNPPSSARFKEEIKPMNQASEVILALKPVTFRYKKEFDPTRIPQFGLVAEEVEKLNPDLVKRDREGKVQTVRYDAVNAMLLNEFLKEHRKNEEQEATITRQQKQIEALTAGLQKVSAQIEASKPAPQTVANNQ